jgi:hypothetical protein
MKPNTSTRLANDRFIARVLEPKPILCLLSDVPESPIKVIVINNLRIP